ncbi:hypothetical protein CEXT_279091 [Caerostris extrusa]|uniref:Uncharacterized protein n=1 Tax=Caerostris extrusa TaxID=172846 RepID=A0AAV4RYE7_CAEEX|nr:hypothetical protein CEXT_279091 [Caerostris extrusa]
MWRRQKRKGVIQKWIPSNHEGKLGIKPRGAFFLSSESRCLRFLILNLLRKEIVVTPNTFPETNQTKINEIIQHLLGGIHIAFENRLRIQKNNFNRSYEA